MLMMMGVWELFLNLVGRECWEILKVLCDQVTTNADLYQTMGEKLQLLYIKGRYLSQSHSFLLLICSCISLRLIFTLLHQKTDSYEFATLDTAIAHWAFYCEASFNTTAFGNSGHVILAHVRDQWNRNEPFITFSQAGLENRYVEDSFVFAVFASLNCSIARTKQEQRNVRPGAHCAADTLLKNNRRYDRHLLLCNPHI
jgi:hypothetical protein